MKYTPIMWDVTTDEDDYLGYIEQEGFEFHPTASSSGKGGPGFSSCEEAADWLLQRAEDKPVTPEPLVVRPDALTDPREGDTQ